MPILYVHEGKVVVARVGTVHDSLSRVHARDGVEDFMLHYVHSADSSTFCSWINNGPSYLFTEQDCSLTPLVSLEQLSKSNTRYPENRAMLLIRYKHLNYRIAKMLAKDACVLGHNG